MNYAINLLDFLMLRQEIQLALAPLVDPSKQYWAHGERLGMIERDPNKLQEMGIRVYAQAEDWEAV